MTDPAAGPVTGSGPHLVDSRLRLPDESWGSWNVGGGIGSVAAELAVRLADGDRARALVGRSVAAINAEGLGKGGLILTQAVWVPDRSTGEVMAIMDVGVRGLGGGEASPEAYLARDLKEDFGRGTKVLDYSAGTVEVAAGRASIEQHVVRLRRERTVQGYLDFLIFPPGACEALALTFNTVHLNLLTAIATQARIIAESVTLVLGEIPGGRPKQ